MKDILMVIVSMMLVYVSFELAKRGKRIYQLDLDLHKLVDKYDSAVLYAKKVEDENRNLKVQLEAQQQINGKLEEMLKIDRKGLDNNAVASDKRDTEETSVE